MQLFGHGWCCRLIGKAPGNLQEKQTQENCFTVALPLQNIHFPANSEEEEKASEIFVCRSLTQLELCTV